MIQLIHYSRSNKTILSKIYYVCLFSILFTWAAEGQQLVAETFLDDQQRVVMYPGSGFTGTNGCSLTLIESGSKKPGPAYLLTAQHCIQYFHPKALLYSGNFDGKGTTIEVTPVAFYNFSKESLIDIAVVKILESIEQLEKLGVKPMKLDPAPVDINQEIVIQGFVYNTDYLMTPCFRVVVV